MEHCSEIFQAVEKITTRSYDLIAADWDDGVEASFLLKTSRELKLNGGAFTLAITSDPESYDAALIVGAMLVLSKPTTPDHAKLAMLNCEDFLRAMRNWLPRLLPAPTLSRLPLQVVDRPSAAREAPFATAQSSAGKPVTIPSPFASDQQVGLWPYTANTKIRKSRRSPRSRGILLSISLIAVFFSVGYIFSEPARGAAVASSVTKICESALTKTHDWLDGSGTKQVNSAPEVAREEQVEQSLKRRIQVIPVYPYSQNSQPAQAPNPSHEPTTLAPLVPSSSAVQTLASVQIPDSLKDPIEASATLRNAVTQVTPTLLGALEPIEIVPEELARHLLTQKVDPSYPEQALRLGLQGPVVLQAWISRDGSIRDLKLVRGSLLLGQSAYQAVKQWRYKPYLLNGQAVEAQTLVTVDFRLPH